MVDRTTEGPGRVPNDTRDALIDSAEHLIRARGYSVFSYADLEKKIGIRKASIHYHFPTKEDLGVAVVEKYISSLTQQLRDIDAHHPSARDRLDAFAELFRGSRATGTLPLCGALAAEMTVLPAKVQSLTTRYFETHLNWLATTLQYGAATKELPAIADPSQRAYEILSLLEGASFVNWGLNSRREIGDGVIRRIVGNG